MLRLVTFFIALVSLVGAQQINFKPSTGTRSLWIPYKTISGVPFASVLDRDKSSNLTTYVISCPTGQPECALKPNLTLTEGTDLARWMSTTHGASEGTVNIICALTNTPVTCFQEAHGNDNVVKTSQVLQASDIVYQEVSVTKLNTDKKNDRDTVTITKHTTNIITTGGAAPTITPGPLAMAGGALGAGLLALAAL